MGGWTGTFMATFLVHTQVGTSSILAIALINVWRRRGRRKLLLFFFSKTHSILSTVCGKKCVSSVEFPSCVLVMCLSQTHSCKNGPHTRHHTVTGVCVWVCKTPLTLAASPISLERVPSGADAVVRAWQVDTLPLTPSLQALIYICVWTQTGSSDFWRKLEKSFFFFTYLHTPPWELVQLNSQVLSFVASCTQVDTRQCSCVRLRLRYARICRSIGTIPVSCGTAPYIARAPD